ncbi:MAG: multicopper oxidase family protein [Vulcanimicrobiaceae bacterium]
MKSTCIAFVALLALTSCGGGSSTGGTPATAPAAAGLPPALPTLPEVDSVNGVAELTLQAKFDANDRPAFFYQGEEVAPTIRVNPGDTIKLHFQNLLPQFCAVGVTSNSNMHFHGLTSSPDAPADDVITVNAAPGQSTDYVVPINTDQPPGLYWYHPHPHGLSSYEVGNGMAGAIVVEGIANVVPATLGLRERIIILQDVPIEPTFAAGESSIARRSERAARRPQDDDEGGGNACGPETDATPEINGLAQAAIGIKPGETELFRVLNASGHRHFDLSFGGIPMQIVAQDGVPIGTYPGAPQTIVVSDWVVPPAGRVEFLITGPKLPTPITSNCYRSGPVGDPNPQVQLGMLADDSTWAAPGQAQLTARVRKSSAPIQPKYYRIALPPPAAERLIHFQEDANGFYIDGQAYAANGAPLVVAQSGTVEEWTLENDTQEVHSFHIHQVHFIVESINGVAQPTPHWADTFDIPPEGVGVSGELHPSQTKILLDFRDPTIRGTFVFHCHILDHEDAGMMAKIQVE